MIRRSPRCDKPGPRVARALARLTRRRWVPYEEAHAIAWSLAKNCSGNMNATVDAIVAPMVAIGCMDGRPPLVRIETPFSMMLHLVKAEQEMERLIARDSTTTLEEKMKTTGELRQSLAACFELARDGKLSGDGLRGVIGCANQISGSIIAEMKARKQIQSEGGTASAFGDMPLGPEGKRA